MLPPTLFWNDLLSNKSNIWLKMNTVKNREGRTVKIRTSPSCFGRLPTPYSWRCPQFLYKFFLCVIFFFLMQFNPEKHKTHLKCYLFSDILFTLTSMGIVGVQWVLKTSPFSLWQRDNLLTTILHECAACCSPCKATVASEFIVG